MVQLTRNQLILAKLETTYRTDPTPSAASNSIQAMDISISEQSPPLERQAQVASLSNLPSLLGERFVEVSFKVEMKGSGSAGTAPKHGVLLQACSMSETIVTGGSPTVTYAPNSTSQASCTIWAYIGGRVHKITGCRGTWKAVCEAGKFMVYEFTFQGYRSATPSVASLPTPTFDTTTAICKNGAFSYNSKTTLIGKMLDVDIANTVSKVPSLSDAEAVNSFEVVARKPMASFSSLTQVETSYDFRGDILTNQRALSYVVGSVLTITLPKFNPTTISYEDGDGVLFDKLSGECAQDSGNDEISLVYEG